MITLFTTVLCLLCSEHSTSHHNRDCSLRECMDIQSLHITYILVNVGTHIIVNVGFIDSDRERGRLFLTFR